MTNQNKTIHVALRILGNTCGFSRSSVKASLWGLNLLAINLQTASEDITDIYFVAVNLELEEL